MHERRCRLALIRGALACCAALVASHACAQSLARPLWLLTIRDPGPFDVQPTFIGTHVNYSSRASVDVTQLTLEFPMPQPTTAAFTDVESAQITGWGLS